MTFSCPFNKRREFSSANASRVNFAVLFLDDDVALGIVFMAAKETELMVECEVSVLDVCCRVTRRAMSTRPKAPLAMSGVFPPLISMTDTERCVCFSMFALPSKLFRGVVAMI